MKLATYRQPGADPQDPGSTFAAIVTDAEGQRATQVLPLEGFADVGEVLAVPPPERDELLRQALEAAEDFPARALDAGGLVPATLIPFPTKVFCIGLNYRNHILETGLELPCLLYTSPSPRDRTRSRMPSSA